MSLESFYGGKPGLSSIIKKAFKYISKQDPAYVRDAKAGKSIDDSTVMDTCLQDNNYEEVWYGELCIIDSDNKNDPANGCLFRRTLSRQGSEYPVELYKDGTLIADNFDRLSAEYIGQINGPRGTTPFVAVNDLDTTDAQARKPLGIYDETAWEISDGQVNYNVQMNNDTQVYRHPAKTNGIFVSGRDYTKTHTEDEITYNWFNIRKGDDTSWVYLGLNIPYFQADFDFELVRYFDKFTQTNEYENRDFYDDWKIQIPRGVRGNAATDIFITTLRQTLDVYQSFDSIVENNTIYSFDELNKVTTEFLDELIGEDNRDEKDLLDIPFYCCKYTIFNENDEDDQGQSAYFFIGLVRHIDSFDLAHDGYITVHYSNDTKQKLNEPIIWIDNITVGPTNADEDDGVLEITYNNEDATSEWTKRFQLVLPKNINYNDDTGKFTVTNTGGSQYDMDGIISHPKTISYVDEIGQFKVVSNLNEETYTDPDNPIEYIHDIDYDDSTGLFIITTNIVEDGEYHKFVVNEDDIVDYVKNLAFDKSTGFFTATTNTGRTFIINEDTLIFAENIEFSEQGIFTLTLTDGTEVILNEDYPVKWVRQISLVGDIDKTDPSSADADRRINYIDNQSDIVHTLGDEINYIQEFVKADNGHLYVLFNAKTHRYTTDGIPRDTTYDENIYRLSGDDTLMYPREVVDDEGHTWRNDIDSTFAANIYWRDYGQSIGYHQGLYIGKVISLSWNGDGSYTYVDNPAWNNINTADDIKALLNSEYPQGFTQVVSGLNGTIDRRGMLAVTRMKNAEYPDNWDSYYFAYNYDKMDEDNDTNEWYLIQKIESISMGGSITIKLDDEEELNTQDAYLNVTNFTTRARQMDAPWIVSGYYAVTPA